VCVHDEAAVIWAGEETPCALGVVCSIGSINQENNAALTAAITELIEPFGVSSDRIYLNVCQPRAPALPCTPTYTTCTPTYTLLVSPTAVPCSRGGYSS